MLLMDTIWGRPQEWVCLFVSICLTLVEHTLWHLFCGGQLLWHVSRVPWPLVRLLFWGHNFYHPYGSSTRRSLGRGVCFCVCAGGVGVKGAPWGEAGQSSPVAAPGQVMAIQDTCLGSQPNLTVASLTLCPIVPSLRLHISLPPTLKLCWPPFNSSVLSHFRFFFLHITVYKCFICLSFSFFPVLSCRLYVCVVLSPPQYFGKVVFLH